jgi:leucyl aminopeptidase
MIKFEIIQKPERFEKFSNCNLVFAYQNESDECQMTNDAKNIDKNLEQCISKLIKQQKFIADSGKVIITNIANQGNLHTIILVGLGHLHEYKIESWMNAIGTAFQNAKQINSNLVNIYIPDEINGILGTNDTVSRAIEAIQLSLYEFDFHKSHKVSTEIKNVVIYTSTSLPNSSNIIQNALIYSQSVIIARNLVNEPSSVTTPSYLAKYAMDVAKNDPQIECEVMGPKEISKLKMEAFLSIARGSDEEPRFIKLSYKGGGKNTVCLVGKGITFDSGGLSLKPENSMETMKCDMAGAATILGIFSNLSKLHPVCNVVGLIVATENMPSGKAIKPGDIVRALNGQSIEIVNTDAEGRVILADAISYAVKYLKPNEIIDLATLTGACMVALGEDIAGLFTNNHEYAKNLICSASVTGEKIWELPLASEYQDLLKSNVADIRNVSKTKYGGAITGALFIAHFVPKNIPWIHLDIAGPAYNETNRPTNPVGGSGFGVRMLFHYLTSQK